MSLPIPGPDLLDALARARHDLGKYVAFQSRSLPPAASDGELRTALDLDLNHTRTRPDASCTDLWVEARAPIAAAGLDPAELRALDEDVACLGQSAGALTSLDRDALWATVSRAIAVGERLRRLHRAELERVGGG